MVQRILDQIQRGMIQSFYLDLRQGIMSLKERLKVNFGKALQASDDPELKQHLARQIADVATSDIGTMDPSFTQRS